MPPEGQKFSMLRNKLLPILTIEFIDEDFNAQQIHNLSKVTYSIGIKVR